MTTSFLQRPNTKQAYQVYQPESPKKGDVFSEFESFRKDTKRKAENASQAFISASEQSPPRPTQDLFSISQSKVKSPQKFALSQTNLSGFGFSNSNKSFEKSLGSSFSSRPKQVLSPGNSRKHAPSTQLLQFSPDKRINSPARLLQRLGSPLNKNTVTQSSNDRSFKRSNSVQGGLQQLLDHTRNKIQQNQATPSSQKQNQGFLGSRPSEVFAASQTAYIIDKRAHDLEDYLMTLSAKDFNQLPRVNVEQLIKLSSVIMSKVKNSSFYRASIF